MDEVDNIYSCVLKYLDRYGIITLECLSCRSFTKYNYEQLLTKYDKSNNMDRLICKMCNKYNIIPFIDNKLLYPINNHNIIQ